MATTAQAHVEVNVIHACRAPGQWQVRQ
jgi:hypothetical protein